MAPIWAASGPAFRRVQHAAGKRQKNLDETLAAFPFVNGELFAENLGFADFNRDMRNALLACTRFDWSRISPAIFGSLFQAIMDAKERRQIGAHYTSERDILKVIRSLFLDDLRAEFEPQGRRHGRRDRLENSTINWPAAFPRPGLRLRQFPGHRLPRTAPAGNGNAARAFRPADRNDSWTITRLSQVDVDAVLWDRDQEWPARIAEVAMWLMDHQMNLRLSEAFGQYFVSACRSRNPRTSFAATRCGWTGRNSAAGKMQLRPGQSAVCRKTFDDRRARRGYGASSGARITAQECSITLRLGIARRRNIFKEHALWSGLCPPIPSVKANKSARSGIHLFQRFGLKIHFAHRTFAWESEARGKAHVHVVIIGFAAFDSANKRIYEYHGEQVNRHQRQEYQPLSH